MPEMPPTSVAVIGTPLRSNSGAKCQPIRRASQHVHDLDKPVHVHAVPIRPN